MSLVRHGEIPLPSLAQQAQIKDAHRRRHNHQHRPVAHAAVAGAPLELEGKRLGNSLQSPRPHQACQNLVLRARRRQPQQRVPAVGPAAAPLTPLELVALPAAADDQRELEPDALSLFDPHSAHRGGSQVAHRGPGRGAQRGQEHDAARVEGQVLCGALGLGAGGGEDGGVFGGAVVEDDAGVGAERGAGDEAGAHLAGEEDGCLFGAGAEAEVLEGLEAELVDVVGCHERGEGAVGDEGGVEAGGRGGRRGGG